MAEAENGDQLPSSALAECYVNVRPFIKPEPESPAVIEAVDQHRRYWRPDRTRLILLAESHVYTRVSELAAQLHESSLLPSGLPSSFVRLVYCLAYGENDLLKTPILLPRNSGTPQFWKLFYSCVNQVGANLDFAPILKSQTAFSTRLSAKVELLRQLQAYGVWLVDASIAALYTPGGQKPIPQDSWGALHASWDGYIRSVIEAENPEGIVCIGKGVRNALATSLDKLGVPWGVIPQPQARLSQAASFRVFEALYAATQQPAQARALTSEW